MFHRPFDFHLAEGINSQFFAGSLAKTLIKMPAFSCSNLLEKNKKLS